jgi:hypothetical protein
MATIVDLVRKLVTAELELASIQAEVDGQLASIGAAWERTKEPNREGARVVERRAKKAVAAVAKPKRVVSEETRAKMSATHQARIAAKKAAANGSGPTEPAPALDAE